MRSNSRVVSTALNVLAGLRGQLWDTRLIFLGDARHDGDDENSFSLFGSLFGQKRLRRCSQHLVRGLARRELCDELWVVQLGKAHPTRAAAREHGPRLALLDPFDEFVRLLHDGKVGPEVGVEDVVEAECAQRGDHAALRGLLAGKAHALAPRRADGGSDLDHRYRLRVGKRREHVVSVVARSKSARRTMGHALTAQGTACVGDVRTVGNPHASIGGGAGHLPHGAMLHLGAFGDAAHAADAFGGIALQGEFPIPRFEGERGVTIQVRHAERVRKILQRAGTAALARGAFAAMACENGLHVLTAGRDGARGRRAHGHAVEHGGVAGSSQAVLPFDLDHAHAARADLVDLRHIAQRRDVERPPVSRRPRWWSLRGPLRPRRRWLPYTYWTLPSSRTPQPK